MTYSYFPGCTLKNKAKDLDHYARECAKVLGFELEEIENWQCCGAVYPQASDEIATKLSSVRALADAKEKGQDLITVCSACHHVIKRVNDDMANVEDIQTKVNNYMALSEPYLGETKVLHYLEVLRDVVGFDKIKEKVVNPLKGRKIGAYYGCMLLRPSTTMQFDDPENPTIIEDFIKALGATPVVYPMRNECCGGYISLKEKKMASNMVDQIMASASYKGAEELITACPLCMYNLRNNGTKEGLPVTYFTELLAEALGIKVVTSDEIRAIAGVDTRKCMRCGKCSASCPAYNEMDIRPHQFVSYVQNGDVEALMNSKSIWKCLSCFACVERCPRDVKPAKLIEAVRLSVIRQKGENYLSPDEIPALLDDETPQQLLMSAFRKYRK